MRVHFLYLSGSKMLPFKDNNHKYTLKNKATSNRKIKPVLSSLSLNRVGLYLSDGPISTNMGRVNLSLSQGTHWVAFIN